MNTKDYKRQESEIDRLIKLNLSNRRKGRLPILDGIISFPHYCDIKSTKFKILWILKETWGDTDGLNYRNDLKDYSLKYTKYPTWKMIAYTSYGILNNFVLWDEMDEISPDGNGLKVAETIKQLAVINIKKIPGKTRSNGWEIEESYVLDKEIILKQIDLFKPDIIIAGGIFNCGSTLDMLLKDIEIHPKELKEPFKGASVESYLEKDRIFISAYHPSYWGVSQKKYCNDIIKTVKILKGK